MNDDTPESIDVAVSVVDGDGVLSTYETSVRVGEVFAAPGNRRIARFRVIDPGAAGKMHATPRDSTPGASEAIGLTIGPSDSESEPEGFKTPASDVADVIGLTIGPSDDREVRLRALYALFFHEAGLDVSDTTISALAAATRRMGYALVPIRR